MAGQITKFSLVTSLGATCLIGSITANAQAEIKKTLIVATEAGYPPYEFLDNKGQLAGFDIELMNYICNELKVTCKWQNQAFDSLIPSLKYKKVDVVIAGLNSNEQRKKLIDFSDEYLPPGKYIYLVLKNSNINDINQLTTVATQNGTLQSKYLTDFTKYKVVNYDTFDNAMLDLKAKRVSGVFSSAELADELVKTYPQAKTLGKPFSHQSISAYGPSIGIGKQDKELLAKINQILKQAKANGVIEKLGKKYNLDTEFN